MRKLATLLVLVLGGCSWMFSRPPSRPAHRGDRLCTPSLIAPAFDTYQAVGGGLIALLALAYAGDGNSDSDTVGTVGVISAGVATAYGISAAYGFRQRRACQAIRREAAAAIRYAPVPGGPMWVTPSTFGAPGDIDVDVELDGDVEIEHETETTTRTHTIIRTRRD